MIWKICSYISNISFCGAQTGFDRTQAGKEGKGSLGHSGNELEGMKNCRKHVRLSFYSRKSNSGSRKI